MTTIDQYIAQQLNQWYVGSWPVGNAILCVIAMLLSVVLCGAIGIERERRGRSAGLRTHLLVGVGSCMIMIISIYGFPVIGGYTRDVARLAAQVIAGVGFLGAGAIIHRNSGTRGLTTAATIWIVMAIGLACGSMNFLLAIGGTVSILIVLTVFRKWEMRITKKTPLMIVRAKSDLPIVTHLLETGQKFDCIIHELHVELIDDEHIEATFTAVSNSNEFQTNDFIAAVEGIEGVLNVSVLNGHKN